MLTTEQLLLNLKLGINDLVGFLGVWLSGPMRTVSLGPKLRMLSVRRSPGDPGSSLAGQVQFIDIHLDSFQNGLALFCLYNTAGILLDTYRLSLSVGRSATKDVHVCEDVEQRVWVCESYWHPYHRYLLDSWTASWSPCPWSCVSHHITPLYCSDPSV